MTSSTSNPGVQFTVFITIKNPSCACFVFLLSRTCPCFVNDDPLAKWFLKLEPRLFVVVFFFFCQKSTGLVPPRVSETKSPNYLNRGPICAPCITHLVGIFLTCLSLSTRCSEHQARLQLPLASTVTRTGVSQQKKYSREQGHVFTWASTIRLPSADRAKIKSRTSQQSEKTTTGPSRAGQQGGGKRRERVHRPIACVSSSRVEPCGGVHGDSNPPVPQHHGPTTPRSIDSHPLKFAPGVPAPALRPAYFVWGNHRHQAIKMCCLLINGVVRVDDGPGQTNAKAKTE